MLISAEPPHKNIIINASDQKELLKKSGALLLRWTNNWDKREPGLFWYVIKDHYTGIDEFSSNTRSKIRRGLKRNDVKKVDKSTLQQSGYSVYYAAYECYQTQENPLPEEDFKRRIEELDDNEYDLWGVFRENKLIAYTEIRIQQDVRNTSVIKFHPDYLRDYPSYALFYTLLEFYMNQDEVNYMSNGSRNISHDTNIQHFLLDKFNYRKSYCELHLAYRKPIGMFVTVFYPFRSIINKIPGRISERVSALLNQEYISRNS